MICMTTQLRYLASIKQTRRNFTSRHGSLHATTPLCVVKKKKRKQLNESRISLREEFSFEGAIIRILASIEPIEHTKTVASLYFSLSLFFLSLPCVEPMILVNFAPSRVVDRERERMATKYRHCEIQWVDL